MKQIDTKTQIVRMVRSVPITYRTGRYTQVSKDESEHGGMLQRGKSFSSTYVNKPLMVISINPIDPQTGERDLDLLRRLYATSTIFSFDTFAVTDELGSTTGGRAAVLPNLGSPGVQADPFVIDADLFATKGRLEFDLEKYPTSEVQIKMVLSHNVLDFNLNIRVDVFSRDEHARSLPAIKAQEKNKLSRRSSLLGKAR
mgnify:CR=1 FL=1